jgi:hypothetical protein
VLAKVNRVTFGLLTESECTAALEEDAHVPRSRLKLAVPFVGKDVPSRSSEFAHPDVIIGLTILAYRYSGFRFDDFQDLVDAMTAEFQHEIGPPRERPSSKRHEAWVLEAGGTIRGLGKRLQRAVAAKKESLQAAAVGSSGESSTGQKQQRKGDTGGDAGSGRKDSAADGEDTEVVQLKFLQKSNEEQMHKLYKLWRHEPAAIHYYLNKFIFPKHMRGQHLKVSASGQAVGGDMLVGRRVGFSGTPSDLLPRELGRCDYEQGDDGKMLTTVLDPAVASYEMLGTDWSVESILSRIAQSTSPRYHALIDTGALITGLLSCLEASRVLSFSAATCKYQKNVLSPAGTKGFCCCSFASFLSSA